MSEIPRFGISVPEAKLQDAARSASRIGTLARDHALRLDFDCDPSGFWVLFERLALREHDA